jgi:hypothetical protein
VSLFDVWRGGDRATQSRDDDYSAAVIHVITEKGATKMWKLFLLSLVTVLGTFGTTLTVSAANDQASDQKTASQPPSRKGDFFSCGWDDNHKHLTCRFDELDFSFDGKKNMYFINSVVVFSKNDDGTATAAITSLASAVNYLTYAEFKKPQGGVVFNLDFQTPQGGSVHLFTGSPISVVGCHGPAQGIGDGGKIDHPEVLDEDGAYRLSAKTDNGRPCGGHS